jgi:hypothetical protein
MVAGACGYGVVQRLSINAEAEPALQSQERANEREKQPASTPRPFLSLFPP